MPLLTKVFWKLNHKWDSDHYKRWTEKMMIDELRDLHKFMVKLAKKNPFLQDTASLELFIELIRRKHIIEIGNQIIDFTEMSRIIGTWKHVTTTCKHYIREWLAQDESRVGCSYDRPCNHFNLNCKDYEPMLKARSIEELIKEEIEWSVS